MPIYNGNSKAKDLYYGGTKIKEAYYGSTKVYSSGPLYYAYKNPYIELYLYAETEIKSVGTYTFYATSSSGKATDSSQLTGVFSYNVVSIDNSNITIRLGSYTYLYTYFPSGNLYS